MIGRGIGISTYGLRAFQPGGSDPQTDADGDYQNDELIGKEILVYDEGGLPVNNGINCTIDKTTGTISTDDARVRTLKIYY